MNYEVITAFERLGSIANEILASKVISLDLETTSISPFDGEIRLCSINTGKNVYVIDLFQTKSLGPIVDALREGKAIVIGQNLKFDQKWLYHKYNLELWPVFDTYRASSIIHNGRKLGHNLWDIYSRELNLSPSVQDLGGSDWSGILTKEQYDYAADDVINLPFIREKQKPKLAELGLNTVALLEFGAILPEASVELNGFNIDQEAWLANAEVNRLEMERLKAILERELPNPSDQFCLPGFSEPINLNSPLQLLASFQKLGLKMEDTTELTLAKFASKSEVITTLLDYRQRAVWFSTFGPEYLRWVNPITGRLHADYFPFTGAGRYRTGKPQLQNIPKEAQFRGCFKAPHGKKLVIADYSNIEMRGCADISDDRKLISLFNKGEDAHYATASVLLGKPISSISKKERSDIKCVNFGLIFGMGAPKLVQYALAKYKVVMSLETAEIYRKKFFDNYRGVKSWHDYIFSHRNGISRTIAGRLRYFDEDTYSEYSNHPIQGTAADGLKRSLREVFFNLKKLNGRAKMVHHVHDEIILEVDDDPDVLETSKQLLVDGMVKGMSSFIKKVPVVVEAGCGESWAEK